MLWAYCAMLLAEVEPPLDIEPIGEGVEWRRVELGAVTDRSRECCTEYYESKF